MKFYTSVLPFKGKLLVCGVNHDGSHKKYRINYKPDLFIHILDKLIIIYLTDTTQEKKVRYNL